MSFSPTPKTIEFGRTTGTATVTTHFTELLQGVFFSHGGLVRALVTLPCLKLRTTVTVEIFLDTNRIVANPSNRIKAITACRKALDYCSMPDRGALISIESNIPQEIGAGSSTGDVVAVIEATTRAIGKILPPAAVAYLTVDTEKASDPVMYRDGSVHLFMHRTGISLEVFPATLPAMRVIGITDGSPVDTDKHPPASYSAEEITEFDCLRNRLRNAILTQNVLQLAAVATRSAHINQRPLPKPHFATWLALMDKSGAAGLSVSHSGSAVAFLFDANDRHAPRKEMLLRECLKQLCVPVLVDFHIGGRHAARAA